MAKEILSKQNLISEAYSASWNGALDAPTKDAIYDKLESQIINPISGFQSHKNGTDQTFTTSTATKVTFGTEVFDVNSEFASDRFTIISGGKYWFGASCRVTTFGTGTTSVLLMLYKNGSLFKTLAKLTTLTETVLTGSLVVDVVDGDYFEIFAQFVGLTAGTATIEGDSSETWFNAIRHASSPGNETTTSLGNTLNGSTAKFPLVDADYVWIWDSVTGLLKKLSWASLKPVLTIPISLAAAAAAAWTNMPSAATFLFGSARHVVKADLTNYSQVRYVVNKQTVAGASGSKLIVRYKTSTYSETVGDYSDIGTSEVSVAVNVTSTLLDTGWINLASGAKADVNIAIVGSGGDGTLDPVFGNMLIMFR